MRLRASLLIAFLVLVSACNKQTPQPATEEKDPVFVGDNTAPAEIRTWNKAKEVKKQVQEKQKENKKILEEGD